MAGVYDSGGKAKYTFTSYAILLGLFCFWLSATTSAQKAYSVIFAGCFSCIEFTWTSITTIDPESKTSVIKFHGKGHTTIEQFYCNVLFMPLFIGLYNHMIPSFFWRVALFPFNTWLLEIIEHTFLVGLIGCNVAWSYKGMKWAYYDGAITLTYGHLWLLMGLVFQSAIATLQYFQIANIN